MAIGRYYLNIINKLSIVICFGVFFMSDAFANETPLPVGEGFGFSSMNVMPDGANGVGVWLSGVIRVRLSNTLNKELTGKLNGVGVVETQLSADDLAQATNIHSKLCQAARQKPGAEVEPMRPPLVYSVNCMENGQLKSYQGQWHELPRELAFLLEDYQRRASKNYADQGFAIVKLDVVVTDMQRKRNKFLVSVKFVNSGRCPILMRRPDIWKLQRGDRLDVGAINTGDNDDWGLELAGVPLINHAEFPDETLTIPAGGNVTFSFFAVPDKKVKRGTYSVGALVVTGVSGEDAAATMGRVGFISDNGKPAVVTLDHDYPSTPEEWEYYETQKRAAMSSQPVYPGEQFAEDGHYRVMSDSGQRSRFVTNFRKGETAPDVRDMAGIADERGQAIHGKYPGWVWEADLPANSMKSNVRCRPGEPCPRNGRWFARIESSLSWPPVYDDSLGELIQCREGQAMPASRKAYEGVRSQVVWEWTGV
jgi:hypothetical protein